MKNFVIIHHEANDPVREFIKEIKAPNETEAYKQFRTSPENFRMRVSDIIEGTWDKENFKIIPATKPKITINGTDNLYDIAIKARKALKPTCNDTKIDNVINLLFDAKPISQCLKPLEQYADITYKF